MGYRLPSNANPFWVEKDESSNEAYFAASSFFLKLKLSKLLKSK